MRVYRVEVNPIGDFANAPGRRVGEVVVFFLNKNSPGEGSWVHIQAIFLNQRKAFPFLIIFVIKKDIHSLFCLNMEWR